METPYIHIKFIPLIKNIVKSDSHYNLEIVPIASSIENIDTIKWKDFKEKIEYTIPMTYKIVIMKQNSREKCVKIYHSCVDIFSTTSLLNVELSAGDIPRVKSEYSILNKTSKCSEVKNITTFDVRVKSQNRISNVDFRLCTKYKKKLPLKIIKSEFHSFSYKNLNMLKEIIYDEVTDKVFKYPTIRSNTEFNCNKVNVHKNDYNNDRNLKNIISSLHSLDSNVDKTKVVKTEIRKKLLITPVYNISTEDKNIPTIYQPFHMTSHSMLDNLNDYNIINKKSKDLKQMNHSKIFGGKLSKYTRTSPEKRVANFVQNMEMEIYPLRIILNDIINKCISSNFYTLLKNQSCIIKNNTKDVNVGSCDVKNDLKSNRVVYSIVFHE